MTDPNIFQTGDDTFTGFAFTPDAPGCDQVEVVASLDRVTNEESPTANAQARDLAERIHDLLTTDPVTLAFRGQTCTHCDAEVGDDPSARLTRTGNGEHVFECGTCVF